MRCLTFWNSFDYESTEDLWPNGLANLGSITSFYKSATDLQPSFSAKVVNVASLTRLRKIGGLKGWKI